MLTRLFAQTAIALILGLVSFALLSLAIARWPWLIAIVFAGLTGGWIGCAAYSLWRTRNY